MPIFEFSKQAEFEALKLQSLEIEQKLDSLKREKDQEFQTRIKHLKMLEWQHISVWNYSYCCDSEKYWYWDEYLFRPNILLPIKPNSEITWTKEDHLKDKDNGTKIDIITERMKFYIFLDTLQNNKDYIKY